ncbi:hypothetical protein HUE87_01430 [Candidatus Sulfurimonas marisnigri]|uniref:Fibrobacter succinogenes major paralogous domain-containing protein n=1 Tax=Candidatus Sulfurimonas marisnigri TaxID=2740405 RepID=A0A7S7M0S8_9BACT|nr:FISUMP domain-containing protein [Candidatus Sulfurimonas marisnigri]QOY54939.1 hypothetical protein HUE87_01430 [Candidatus Sulfurimonas marisnigri]
MKIEKFLIGVLLLLSLLAIAIFFSKGSSAAVTSSLTEVEVNRMQDVSITEASVEVVSLKKISKENNTTLSKKTTNIDLVKATRLVPPIKKVAKKAVKNTSRFKSKQITHKGKKYLTVKSPYTKRIWLDRNLGAYKVCSSFDDKACYGDHYQWGRNSDGHQNASSTTAPEQATDVNMAGVSFITTSTSPYDWTQTDNSGKQRAKNWSKADGTSVCPVGYRVPTIIELESETIGSSKGMSNNKAAYTNFLKFPSSGNSFYGAGSSGNVGSSGFVWSSDSNGSNSGALHFSSSTAYIGYDARALGFSVRCIQDKTLPTASKTANAGVDQTVMDGTTVKLIASGGSNSKGTIANYTWKENAKVLSTKKSFSKSNFSLGVHNITLTVVYKDGTSSSDRVIVTVVEFISQIITHKDLEYKTLLSPHTKRVWLDRNLGAIRVCKALYDKSCYGDYYQWGRNSDGHQKGKSFKTSLMSTDLKSAGNNFITDNGKHSFDWTVLDSDGSMRSANWSATDGHSICPVGYRVPTITEIEAETTGSSKGMLNNKVAYANFLKIPSSGYRSGESGSLDGRGSYGVVWSTSASGAYSGALHFSSNDADIGNFNRADGITVRCIGK